MSQPLTQKLVQIYMSTSIEYLSTRQLDTPHVLESSHSNNPKTQDTAKNEQLLNHSLDTLGEDM